MLKKLLLFLLLITFSLSIPAQDRIYQLDLKRELITIGAGVGLTTLGEILRQNTKEATLAEINALDPQNIWSFDRGAANNNSAHARNLSDIILYSSATLPIIAYLLPKTRFEGVTIGVMGIEAFLLTYGLTSIAKGATNRYRPFNYNREVDLERKLGEDSRKSFFSGHTSVTATMTFMIARVITDIHPNLKHKYIYWTTAAAIPAAIGYLRFKGGKHFPSDVIVGYLVGGAVGFFVPALHKNEKVKIDTYGAGLSIKFNLN